MNKTNDTWTRTHDLALLFVALAYGTDNQLSDLELETITHTLQGWSQTGDESAVQELVLEAMTIFLEENAEQEVVRSMQSLRQALSEDERRQALEEMVHLAEADGIVLSSEQSLIFMLAEVWEIKKLGIDLLDGSTVMAETRPDWSLLHDISLVYLVLAHSTDNDLSQPEIDAMLARLGDWQPRLSPEDMRGVLREALQFYASGPDEAALQHCVRTLREALPIMQRLALLDDLTYIARCDGDYNDEERRMIMSLAKAWELNVRLNGQRAEV